MDWRGLMRLGLFELKLHPKEFWDLTPTELLAMLGQMQSGALSLGRAQLEELIAKYPDKRK